MYIQCCAPVVPDAFFMMCDLWSSEILHRIFEYLHRAMSDIDEPEVAVATDDLPEAEAPDSSLSWNVVGAVTTESAPDSGEISSLVSGIGSGVFQSRLASMAGGWGARARGRGPGENKARATRGNAGRGRSWPEGTVHAEADFLDSALRAQLDEPLARAAGLRRDPD